MIEQWEANRKAENRAFWRNRLKWGVTTVLFYTLLIPQNRQSEPFLAQVL